MYVRVEGASELATTVQEALPDALADTNVRKRNGRFNLNAVDGPACLSRQMLPNVCGRRCTAGPNHRQSLFRQCRWRPWPEDKPMILTESPEIQSAGEISISDTWGLLSKPAYNRLLGRAMTEAVATKLQENVFRLP